MKFEEIRDGYGKGEKVKIYVVHKDLFETPYFITGIISQLYPQGELSNCEKNDVNRVDFYPWVAYNSLHGCDEKALIGMPFGSKWFFRGMKIDEPFWDVTNSFEEHETATSKIMINSVCKKEADAFNKYLREAKKLK